jgi:hypothetical protein
VRNPAVRTDDVTGESPVTTDDGDPIGDDRAREVIRMLSNGLRQARAARLWTRSQLVARMRTPIPVNTYAGYEQRIRVCSLPRLVDICHALDIAVMVSGTGVKVIPAAHEGMPSPYFVAVQRNGGDLEVTVRMDLGDGPPILTEGRSSPT